MSFAIVVNALVATCLSSQIRAATINGFVTDAATGENLPGATVIFKNLNVGTLSNDEGYYAIKNLPSGDHIMRITYIGYESQLDTISFLSLIHI